MMIRAVGRLVGMYVMMMMTGVDDDADDDDDDDDIPDLTFNDTKNANIYQ